MVGGAVSNILKVGGIKKWGWGNILKRGVMLGKQVGGLKGCAVTPLRTMSTNTSNNRD